MHTCSVSLISLPCNSKLTKTKINEWSANLEKIPEGEVYRNFKRNQQLIDLDYVPNPIEINILDDFKGDHFIS